jgi:hypothetical protein
MLRIAGSIGAAIAIAVAAILVLGGGAAAESERVEGRGVAVELPAGWQSAERSLTPALDDPRELLSVATFKPRYRRTNCEAFAGSGQRGVGTRGAFVTLQERAPRAGEPNRPFPPRPAHFGSRTGKAGYDCSGARARSQWIPFSDGGRNFYALVVTGRAASAERRREAYRILDSLQVDPGVRPDWPGSP